MGKTLDPLLVADDNPLQEHYQRFRVSQRILLSGHSHQAWPDAAFDGQIKAFEDAANLVDDKWQAAFKVADDVRSHLAVLLNTNADRIVLGASTHDLLLRFLSCLPLRAGSHIVTTDGEFHSMRRQLARLQETGLQISVVPVQPLDTLAIRMIEQFRRETVAVLASVVMFQDSTIFADVEKVIEEASRHSIPALVDSYHAVNVFPVDVANTQLRDAFVIGGGYKYLQAGEGNCFLALPKSHNGWEPRPIITGWFAEFAELQHAGTEVEYGTGHSAFAGSTYDPTSHYRADAVFQFFREQKLMPARLQSINQTQMAWLYDGLEDLKLSPRLLELPAKSERQNRGGFLALRSHCADQWVKQLRSRNVFCDSRNGFLRIGPAPYVSREQITQAIEIMGQIGKKMSSSEL